jgi:hypothetical protein
MPRSGLLITTADASAFGFIPAFNVVAAAVMTADNHTLCFSEVTGSVLKDHDVLAATGTPNSDQPFAVWDPEEGKSEEAVRGGVTFPFPHTHPLAAELKIEHLYLVSPLTSTPNRSSE